MTEITVYDLTAEDSDTPPEGLEFVVTPPSNGHLALKSAPSRHILNFTQNHIKNKQLLFVHSGEHTFLFKFVLAKDLLFDAISVFVQVPCLVDSTFRLMTV